MALVPLPPTAAAARTRALELARCRLTVLSGPERGKERLVSGGVFQIGRAPENDLVLNDDTVSRQHCLITHEPKGYLLKDLGSTSGTLLDGAEIKEAYLKPGAIITLGKVELKARPFRERLELAPSDSPRFGELVGKSVAMRELFGLLQRLAATEEPVLISGEAGTGKDALARAIHAASPRASKPFVVGSCGVGVGTLLESELFGHEKGAFAGATALRQGAFELAHGGTLWLDDVAELPLEVQPKVLRVLEQRTLRRIGGHKDVRVDVRVLAGCERPLRHEVERGKFSKDLWFRLALVPVELPPLRERREDVPMLVEALLERLSAQSATRAPLRLTAPVLEALSRHDWPGNVRELRDVLERAASVARPAASDELGPSALPLLYAGASGVTRADEGAAGLPAFVAAQSYRATRAEWEAAFEQRYVTWLLERHEGNISAAARGADMDRKYLHKLLKKHGLHPSGRKEP